ncbi:double-strand break repair protein MRE11 isoform X1 [Schistocerca americana]|uniref:double-strand break repair protein MRE11 isoform X1 n=1 Tax=Schistocerca americana TaxID=7009 RepID=UPI001F4FF023|nr:double-strand break repair protein MRE11 isoform X1 [Schistocerca americana]
MKDDTFNIMIASDIHLGYNESDPIRGEDSFITFEEILSTAAKKEVDFILLGGDLFHDNKPSQRCLYRCLSLLRRYCMGDRPVPVEFLSDPSENFRHCDNPVVNYEDENLNISMPVFSIHGNHDDPSGHGWISSLDLLSVSGLVNYFGKWSDLKEVSITPLLLRKGQSHLALYGLSHIKDERLSRIFRDGKAKFYRPREHTEEWFNLFVLHQNRANRGPNNFIAESALPDFLDLVLWGHEHECRIAPEQAEGGNFYITQPGSPVATSLCEGEAKEKHCAILKIRKKNFKLDLIPLRTVRPFVYDTITLSKCNINMADASKPSHAVQNYVGNYIQNMLDSAARQLSGDPKQPLIPLVRLRVEYADETQMFNEIRFGQMYQEKVANPQDMVMLRKERADGKKNITSDAKLDRHAMDALLQAEDPELLSNTHIETFVQKYFEEVNPEGKLRVLSVRGLTEAVTRYVEKDDRNAIKDIFNHQVKRTLEYLDKKNVASDKLDEEIENYRLQRQAKQEEEMKEVKEVLEAEERNSQLMASRMQNNSDEDRNDAISSGSDDDGSGAIFGFGGKESRGRGSRGSPRPRGRGRAARGVSKEDATGDVPARARGGRGSRGPRGSRGKGTYEPVAQRTIAESFTGQSSRSSGRSTKKSTIVFSDSD